MIGRLGVEVEVGDGNRRGCGRRCRRHDDAGGLAEFKWARAAGRRDFGGVGGIVGLFEGVERRRGGGIGFPPVVGEVGSKAGEFLVFVSDFASGLGELLLEFVIFVAVFGESLDVLLEHLARAFVLAVFDFDPGNVGGELLVMLFDEAKRSH